MASRAVTTQEIHYRTYAPDGLQFSGIFGTAFSRDAEVALIEPAEIQGAEEDRVDAVADDIEAGHSLWIVT